MELIPIIFFMSLWAIVVLAIALQTYYNDSAVSIYLNPVKDKEGKIEGWQSVQIDWFYLRGIVSVIGCYFKRLFTLGAFKFNWEVK